MILESVVGPQLTRHFDVLGMSKGHQFVRYQMAGCWSGLSVLINGEHCSIFLPFISILSHILHFMSILTYAGRLHLC